MRHLLFPMAIAFTVICHSQKLPVDYVNPLIGTEKMGHTYPGATVPFGAVQLSPDTDTIPYEVNGKYNGEVYKYCAGYKYEDPTIVGFSHTHMSGTGHSDLGDFLIMPTQGKLQMNPGTATAPESGYRSRFSHANETAQAGYYKVLLDDHQITAELTTSNRVGMHRYTFQNANEGHIILDLMSGIYNFEEKNVWTFVRVVNDTLITGYRQTSGWARTRTVYFAMVLSKPFSSFGQSNYDGKKAYRGFWGKFDQNNNFPEIAGRKIRLHFDFPVYAGEQISIKFALSAVSQSNALENLQAEINHWDFDQVKLQARDAWSKELNKVRISASETVKTNFYTAMYHAFLSPTVFEDVNGSYKGLDQNTHKSDSFTNYSTFSLWDTYRALHPLFNLLQQQRNDDMAQSMLAHYDQSTLHMLPIWSHYANDNWCMSGYHSVSVLTDAIIKGNFSGNPNEALDACIATANHRTYEGIGEYVDRGFISAEKSGISVSNALEYAYDDWCIAQLAKHLNRTVDYTTFLKRSQAWKTNFNPQTGFMQAKTSDGKFVTNFDPLSTNHQGFIEGNAWNYSFFVPQDPTGLVQLMGGKKSFTARLDTLFSMHLPDAFFAETEDITREGIIGGYVHGNEPAHHVPYLYNWTDQPWKTQAQVRKILNMQYQPTPDGLGGNDDCGQMSAWYIFSALGFYPVSPGSLEYSIGSPIINEAQLSLENGKSFVIKAINQSDRNIYVQKVMLNGKEITNFTLNHDAIMNGGTLEYIMGAKPKK